MKNTTKKVTKEEVEKEIKAIVDDFLLQGTVTDDADLANDLYITTAEFFHMLGMIKEAFDIEIKDDDIGQLVTVKNLVDFVNAKLK